MQALIEEPPLTEALLLLQHRHHLATACTAGGIKAYILTGEPSGSFANRKHDKLVSEMPHILIITGDAGESYEALYAIHRFREAGWRTTIAAPSVRRLHLVMHDFEPGWDTYIERPGYGLESDISFDQINATDYDAILILGGRAPEYLRNDQRLLEVVREFDVQQKWIFAICHGIQILAASGLTKGKRITCYEHVRVEAEQAGGTFIDQQAIRDGRLITGQTWQSHPEFYREIFSCLV